MYETLDPAAAKERLDQGDWTFLDIRSVEEFDAGHAAGAYNIPLLHQDPLQGMVPNPDFLQSIKKHFAPDANMVLG
jgi:rhodanese-related sulfurtransferase